MRKEKEEIIEKAKKIQGWMKDEELSALYDICQKYIQHKDKVFEVGSWKGKSSFVIASVCDEKGAELECIDTFSGSELNEPHYKEAIDLGVERFMKENILKNLKDMNVTYYIANSLEFHKKMKDGRYKLGFVDGNHCEPVISQDLDNYYPKVMEKGIFLCHDYCNECPHVVKAINKKFYNVKERLFYSSIFGIVKK